MSQHIKVIDIVLDIWIQNVQGDWIWKNGKYAVTEMLDNVTFLSEKFWHEDIKEKAVRAIAEMVKVDKATFHKLRLQQKQSKTPAYRRKYVANECQKQWGQVVELATENWEETDRRAKKHEIYDRFHNEGPESLAPTHFLPPPVPDAKN
jgi:hypothetical protein